MDKLTKTAVVTWKTSYPNSNHQHIVVISRCCGRDDTPPRFHYTHRSPPPLVADRFVGLPTDTRSSTLVPHLHRESRRASQIALGAGKSATDIANAVID